MFTVLSVVTVYKVRNKITSTIKQLTFTAHKKLGILEYSTSAKQQYNLYITNQFISLFSSDGHKQNYSAGNLESKGTTFIIATNALCTKYTYVQLI